MISDIFTYDLHPQRLKKETVLILSLDEAFKNKAQSENSLCIGFAENSIDDVKHFRAYFKFFCKVLSEVDKVIIDAHFYSQAISIIHSSALNLKNIKEVILYVDEYSKENIAFYSKDPALSSLTSNKEKTYSRQEFLNS